MAEGVLDLIGVDSVCRNSFDAIKLKKVQHFFKDKDIACCTGDLVRLYVEWRDMVELLPMRLGYKCFSFKDFTDSNVDPLKWIDLHRYPATMFNNNPCCNVVAYETRRYQWVNKKSVKRGNDVYIDLMRKKFEPLFDGTHIDFFSTVVNKKRRRVKKTKMLYLTGTCDRSITGDIAASWLLFGEYWNRFITEVRNMFGDACYIRAWQSQDNGYPHFHALVYFFDFEFTAVYWPQDKTYRVHNKQKVVVDKRTGKKEYVRDVLKDRWIAGNLDIQCCSSSKEALTDLLKYVLRDLEGGASDLTNAMAWFFNKKTFAVSRQFFHVFGVEPGASLEPSDADLISAEGAIQEGIQEDTLVSIDIFPIIPREMMPYYHQLTLDNWDHPPDPPPELVEFLEHFALSCVPSSFNVRDDGVAVTVYKYKDGV